MTAFLIDYSVNERLGLLAPCKSLSVEITRGLTDIGGLDGYQTAYTLFTDAGTPLGLSILPVHNGYCRAQDQATALERHTEQSSRLRSRRALEQGGQRPPGTARGIADLNGGTTTPGPGNRRASSFQPETDPSSSHPASTRCDRKSTRALK